MLFDLFLTAFPFLANAIGNTPPVGPLQNISERVKTRRNHTYAYYNDEDHDPWDCDTYDVQGAEQDALPDECTGRGLVHQEEKRPVCHDEAAQEPAGSV